MHCKCAKTDDVALDFGRRDAAYDRFLCKLESRLEALSESINPSLSVRYRTVCTMRLKDFIDRVVRGTYKYAFEDNETLLESTSARCAVMSVEYVERACMKGLPSINLYRLFLAGFMIAFKFMNDAQADAQWWAHVGGFDLKEINAAELQLCCKLDWQMSISPISYSIQLQKLTLANGSFRDIEIRAIEAV